MTSTPVTIVEAARFIRNGDLLLWRRGGKLSNRIIAGGDSNLAIGLGGDLSVLCSHPECARSWTRIPLEKVRPVLGGDCLFEYLCPRHRFVEEPSE